MVTRVIIFCVVVTVAYAGTIALAPETRFAYGEEYDPNPQYSYGYDVHDGITGDTKSQSETRNGDTVQGSYSLIEADGTRRIVDYTADSINGFNAVVRKEPLVATVAKVATPISYSYPAGVSTPLAYYH